ncbi:MAG: N-acetylmuramoyl-L-alanine amidase, partial [Anaerolineales bacterium]
MPRTSTAPGRDRDGQQRDCRIVNPLRRVAGISAMYFVTDSLGQAATLTAADSARVDRVVPAALCGVRRHHGVPVVRQQNAITHVVIHTLLTTYAGAIQRWRDGGSCLPPHYVISNAGEITQMVAEQHIAQHAGQANGYSIGIEHEGGGYEYPGRFSEALYQASARL